MKITYCDVGSLLKYLYYYYYYYYLQFADMTDTYFAYSVRTNQRLNSVNSRPMNVHDCRLATNQRLKSADLRRRLKKQQQQEQANYILRLGPRPLAWAE